MIDIDTQRMAILVAELNRAERERDALRAALRHEADCVEACKSEIERLRAKIERMEKQEPAWFIDERGDPKRYHKSKADYCKYGGLDLLYALPGAQAQPAPSELVVTPKMEQAFHEKVEVTSVGSIRGLADGIKAAMLAAAPEAKS